MNRISQCAFGSVQGTILALATALSLNPIIGYGQQAVNLLPQQPQASPRVVQQFTQQLFILEPMPGEQPALTEEQMEILLAQIISQQVRNEVLVVSYSEFVAQYSAAKTRTAEEEVLFRLNRDAQNLRSAPVELIPPQDVQILPQPLDVDQRRWQVVREWGVVPETRMGEAIDCRDNPYGFARARSLIITALIERTRNRIPDFDTARAASFLRAFDRCMASGPDDVCKLGLATDHAYLNWAVGGRGPAFNLHYVPDATNQRAVNAKSLAVYDDVFGIWYDVGCACGGNFGEIAGANRKVTFTTQVNAPLCMIVHAINGTPSMITSDRPTADFAADLRGDRAILDGQWTLNGRPVVPEVRITSQGLENGTPYVDGQSIVHIPLQGLAHGTYQLRYHAVSKERFRSPGMPYEVECGTEFTVNIPPPPPPPTPECKTLTTKVVGDQVVNTVAYANSPTLDRIDFVVLRKDGSIVAAIPLKARNGEYRFPLSAITKIQQFGDFYVSAAGFDKSGKKLWECPANLNGPPQVTVVEPCPICKIELIGDKQLSITQTAKPAYRVTLDREVEMVSGVLKLDNGKTLGTGLMDTIDLSQLPHDQNQKLTPGKYRPVFYGQYRRHDGTIDHFECPLEFEVVKAGGICRGYYAIACLAPLGGLAALAGGGKGENKPSEQKECFKPQGVCVGVNP